MYVCHFRNAVLWFVLLMAGCTRHVPQPITSEVQADLPDQESWEANMRVSEDGRQRFDIVAPHLAKFENDDSTYMLLSAAPDDPDVRVVAYIFNSMGDSMATLTADRIYYYDQQRRFEAEGDVVIETMEKKKLESERLVWYDAERKIRTPGFVRITTAEEQVQGYRLEADEDLTTYKLERVTGKREITTTG